MNQTDCPSCGFSGLHCRSVAYSQHVVKTWHCAVCGHRFDTQHEFRGQSTHHPGVESDQRGLQGEPGFSARRGS